MTVPEIEANAVPDDAYLLDVREQDEWLAGHAPEAVHIPMSQIQGRVEEVPADRTVYVVCRVGGRSMQVTAWLNQLGRDAVNVGGGMQSWESAHRPMVSETGQQPFVA
ncbi:rhodanese-like domain-containing protein [Nonomuraea spiralis]|uniref:Rhodanese-like domain-containing protein n=1 Tax=Nonomuraea spiralis TaxID=46182 RepID=A0ABV5IBX7_9ACTN|nr:MULTISPECIES: rhodanese-like domain-containing protein [Nonomuraea]RSN03684.1 rhodanese-like domain-containing protein [Nonomuraea sp. WAC 01424]GGS79523.1 sulfurtransferase [Nonomuraea spiralis]